MKGKKYMPAPKEWEGYSFDELQYARAAVATRLEINKYKIKNEFQNLKNGLPAFGSQAVKLCFMSLSYLDYIVFAVKAFRKIKEMFRSGAEKNKS